MCKNFRKTSIREKNIKETKHKSVRWRVGRQMLSLLCATSLVLFDFTMCGINKDVTLLVLATLCLLFDIHSVSALPKF